MSVDLCTIGDVLSYVPGYESDEATDAVLARLITSESEAIPAETGREIIPFADQPETRSFELDRRTSTNRRLELGDLSSAGDTDITVEILALGETDPVTVDRANYRPLYRLKRYRREEWEPVTALEFLPAAGGLHEGRTVLVTGSWGFPMVPSFVREATAKRVILRYVSDVASSGTAFADAIDSVNLPGLFASARDAVELLRAGAFIR